jgi:glycopeptide antibiotics resistance protein
MFRALFAASVVIIAALLLWPQHVDGFFAAVINGMPWAQATRTAVYEFFQAAANVVLFVPVGLLGYVWLRRWWVPLVVGFGLSLLLEVAQTLLPGRTSDGWDVVWNTLGAGVGVGIGLIWFRYGRGRPLNRPR